MTKKENSTDVLIIGGGASAVAMATALGGVDSKISIVIAEKNSVVGLGVAYATELEQHILNVPAGVMGIYHQDPEHFFKWLSSQGFDYTRDDFVPRQIYGLYLQSFMAGQTVDGSVKMGAVRIWRDDIVGFSRKDKGYVAYSSAGEELKTRFVVLATGHTDLQLPVRPIRGKLDRRVIVNPWQRTGYADLGNVKRIGIFGSGLTAMDVVGALDKLGFTGEIVLLSRRGLIPFATSGQGVALEVCLDSAVMTLPLRGLLRWIRKEIRSQMSKGREWSAVIDAFRPQTVSIWRRLTEFERGQFIRHLRPYWDVVRHRMPAAVRGRVDQLKDQGCLSIIKARVLEMDLSSSDNSVVLTCQVKGKISTMNFDRIFNCTGSSALTADNLPQLLKSLQVQGLCQFDRFGLGVCTAPTGELLDREGEIISGCFVIGPLRRASDWESTAMREVRQQAFEIAEAIFNMKKKKVIKEFIDLP